MATKPRSGPLEILLLSYHFPPLGGMASNRAARFVNELSARGHRLTVVAPAGDPLLEGPCLDIDPDVRVVRTSSRHLSGVISTARSLLPRRMGGTRGAHPGLPEQEPAVIASERRERHLRRWLRDWVYVPDAQISWFPAARKAAARELDRLTDPVLWTTSVPYTSHLVGAALQRQAGVDWVAEFRDPWARAQDADLRSRRRRALDRRMEHAIVTRPDRLIFTTPETVEAFAADHGSWITDRSTVVPNVWCRDEVQPPDPPGPDEPMRLVYAGSLNNVQDPRPLVEALSRIVTADPGALELHVYGPDDRWPTTGPVHLHGTVAPELVPEHLRTASALVLLGNGVRYRPILLGKTMDWLGSGQPCLAIVEPVGAMARLVEESRGGVVASAATADAIEVAVRTLLCAHREGTLDQLRPSPAVADRFELGSVTDRLVDALDPDHPTTPGEG